MYIYMHIYICTRLILRTYNISIHFSMTITMTSLLRKGTYILFTQVYNKYMTKYLQKDQVPKLRPK